MGTLPARAQSQNRAGLVVQFSNGSKLSRCVQFGEDSITGYDLIRRAKIPIAVEFGSVGAAVCKIGNEGCSFPGQSCFCQCEKLGEGCTYWVYSQLKDNAWTISGLGAGNRVVRNGDVDGWRWGKGNGDAGELPVSVTFDSVCVAHIAVQTQAQVTPTSSPTQPTATQLEPTATLAQSTEVVASTATPQPQPTSSTPTAVQTQAPSAIPAPLPTTTAIAVAPVPATQDASSPNLLPYAGFGALAFGLVVMVLIARRRA